MARSESGALPEGLMAFWATIAPPDQPAYTRWHNAEHIPERLSIAGFMRGARYRSVRDSNRFLMFYETAGAHVLASDDYLRALNNPTPRTRQALPWFRDPVRNVYRLLAVHGHAQATAAPVLATVKFTGHGPLPDRLTPGPLASFHASRIAVYGIESAVSSVRSNESSLHGAASESAGGLVRIESSDLSLLDAPQAWGRFAAAVQAWCAQAGIQGLGEIDIASVDYCQVHSPQETS
jgi:hypothetical protein